MNAIVLDVALLAGIGLAVYAGLVWLANLYSQRTGWQPPEGTAENDWRLRRNLGIALGSVSMVACALFSALSFDEGAARLIAVGQAALLAAAGTSDLRRFHLPLPLTLTGLVFAVAVATRAPLLVTLFSLAWALVVILLHVLASKGSMQLGDHLATIWIALAAPFNGLVAVALGDLANIALAQMRGLRGKRVAVAGAWLILAAGLIGLPPYFVWFAGHAPAAAEAPAQETQATEEAWVPALGARRHLPPERAVAARALAQLADWASDYTASVALAENRAERIARADLAGRQVAGLAVVAQRIAPGSDVADCLSDLAEALRAYDVEEVRAASWRLAGQREWLAAMLAPAGNDEWQSSMTQQSTTE